MKILQISAFYPPSLGGTQYFAQALSRALVHRGHSVDVLTVNTENAAVSEVDSIGVNIRRCKLDASYHRGLISSDFAARLMKAQSYDLYHVHIPFALGLELAVLASRRNRKPIVATHHGQGIQGDLLYTLIAGSYSMFSRAITFRGAHCLIFLTQSYADSLWLPGAVRRRVRIVRTGADISGFSPNGDGSGVRQRYGMGDGTPLLLFVGSLRSGNRYKGVNHLIWAMARIVEELREARLMIVGGGELVPELEELTQQLGLEDSVVFVGPLDNSLLPEYYAASDVLVLPSIPGGSENSPVVVFEAMASGKPVVASRLPGVCDIVQHQETGLLVPPGDSDALARALVKVLVDDEFRSTAGRKARSLAENHSWDQCAAEMETIYRKMIGK
jgi:glycosyltransferase involved in cell wall biosynthesis